MESVKKSMPFIKNTENGNKFIWMYLIPEMDKIQTLYDNLSNIHWSSPSNSVIITISGNKDFGPLNQFSFLLVRYFVVCLFKKICFVLSLILTSRLHEKAKAIRDGDVMAAESIAAQIRNENFNAKQYPFWIHTKN